MGTAKKDAAVKEGFKMSKKVTENTEEQQKKVVTKYDLKMQRREAEKKKAERDKRMSTIISVVICVLLVGLVASFPIRTYLTVNGTYVRVAGESVSRVEFDYNYNMVKNNYIAQNGYYMSLLGINMNGDLSQQMYSDTMTWKDYFEQMAIENIINNKALKAQMKEEGFTYDTTQLYEEYRASVKEEAAAENMTEREYLQTLYGAYANASRLKGFVTEAMELNAYYEKVSEEKAPSEAEIQAYYEENTASYDSVDYRLTIVNAELPTEPTELADPVDETEAEESEAADTETTYQPSEAEIAYAMEIAYVQAEEALTTISTDGELRENVLRSSAASLLRDWLFSEDRKAGDTTIVENSTSNLYYVAEFLDRYRDETPSVDARVIIVDADDAVREDAILAEWKKGAATEDSFAELADKYNGSSADGGLYEGLLSGGLPDALTEWLNDGARVSGDTTAITGGEGESSYVVYYKGTNAPRWSLSIESTLLSQAMSEYMDEISEGYEVEDPKGNLNYYAASESAVSESSEESSASDNTEDKGESSSDNAADAGEESSTGSAE